jgi:hypothetical protein
MLEISERCVAGVSFTLPLESGVVRLFRRESLVGATATIEPNPIESVQYRYERDLCNHTEHGQRAAE